MRDEYLNETIDLLFRLPRIMKMSLHRELFRPVLETANNDLVPHHIAILKVLEEQGVLHIAEIGDNIAISRAQMTHSIDRLLSLGMVERQHDVQDRRKINIRLTMKGRGTIEKVDAVLRKRIREKLSNIKDEELERLVHALNYLIIMFEKWS
jgi:DNA-binding MarR family transcriptional regulator